MRSAKPFDVILLDCRMTPIDGLQTLRALRGLLGAGMPPSILVTAFDDPDLDHEACRAGFDAVLLKPVSASALHDALARLLRVPAQAVELALSRHYDLNLRTYRCW